MLAIELIRKRHKGPGGGESKMSLACSVLAKQRREMMFSPSVLMYLNTAR